MFDLRFWREGEATRWEVTRGDAKMVEPRSFARRAALWPADAKAAEKPAAGVAGAKFTASWTLAGRLAPHITVDMDQAGIAPSCYSGVARATIASPHGESPWPRFKRPVAPLRAAAPTLWSQPAQATRPAGPFRPSCWTRWTPIGGRRTICRSARSTCRTIRCSKSRCKLEHIKPRLLGHWGTTTGLNFIYVHLNRLIVEHDLDMIYVMGPGHGGPGLVAQSYLEGSYTERYPSIERNRNGMQRLFRQFSWPYGIPSHVAPETPGSIHEGGELGYSLVHAYGAAFDNPDLIVACVIGDGEAETGAAGGQLALQQVPQSARATARCCRSCT